MVPQISANVDQAAIEAAQSSQTVHSGPSTHNSRAPQKQKMEDLRMEDLWKDRLVLMGWPEDIAHQARYAWADSTRDLYNRLILRLKKFCMSNDGFPTKPH